MKTYAQNPWLAQDILDFNFLCCPECAYKSKVENLFIEHAVEIHPKSKISKIFNEYAGVFPNQNVENEDRIINLPTDTTSIDMAEESFKEKYQLDSFENWNDYSTEDFNEEYHENGKLIIFSFYSTFLKNIFLSCFFF